MRAVILLVILCCLCSGCFGEWKDYKGYALFRVTHFHQVYDDLVERFDIWGRNPEGLDVFAEEKAFVDFMSKRYARFEVVSRDISSQLGQEFERLQAKMQKTKEDKPNAWFDEYHNYNDTLYWYQELAQLHSDIATFIPSIGVTWLGRNIFAFRFTANPDPNRPKLWIQCNIHAREWITSASCMYVVNEILNSYKIDPEVTALIQELEFVIIPIVNPDGYDYTWTNDRLWRKNRRNNGNSYGVDLNRNYEYQWGGVGSSPTPSADTYRGPSAASEPETQAVTNYYDSLTNVIGACDVHSYSQYILHPYAHITAPSPDAGLFTTLTNQMASLIRGVHGKIYTPGQWYTVLYPSSGIASDTYYSRGAFGITLELRPTTSVPGFILPPEEIIPTGQELVPAFLYFARFSLSNSLSGHLFKKKKKNE